MLGSRQLIGLFNIAKSNFSISHSIKNNIGATCGMKTWTLQNEESKASLNQISKIQVRKSTNFFTSISAKALWRSVTGVSNAGRKRGRARANRRNYAKDLNKGQIIGDGVDNFAWHGLNALAVSGNKIHDNVPLPPNEDREKNLIEIRNKMGKPKKFKESNLRRGFSGGTFRGRRFGPPDPFEDCNFEGFESVVLDSTRMMRMDGLLRRMYTVRVCVVIGNGDGVLGYAECEASKVMEAIKKAKNLAARNLFGVHRHGNTIPSSFCGQVHCSKVYVEPRLPGRGLACMNQLRAICELAGIIDIRAKISGSSNKPNIIKAFIQGLAKMQTLEDLANEKKLNIVDFSGYYPKLLASPSTGMREHSEIREDEELDVHLYTLKTSMIVPRKELRPFYTHHPGHYKYLKEMEHKRYAYRKRLRLLIERGSITSFLTDKYKEALPFQYKFEGMTKIMRKKCTEYGQIPEEELEDDFIPKLAQKARIIDVY